MADEFQAEVCGGWWNSSRSLFGSSPCSSGILDLGSFGWPTHDFLDIKTRSTTTDHHSNSASDGSIVIQDFHKPKAQQPDSSGSNISINSTLQIMGIGLNSSSTTTTPTTDHHWDRTLVHGNGRPDQSSNNYPPILQQDQNSSMNYRQESGVEDCPPHDIQKDWRRSLNNNNFSAIAADHHDHHQDSSINCFKSLGNQPLNSITSSSQCTASFPINSDSYGYSSTLLQNLFDAEADQPQQPALYGSQPTMNYPPSTNNYQTSLNDLPKFSPLQKPQHPNNNNMQFSASQNFCNGSAAALNDFRGSYFPNSTQSQFLSSTFNDKANLPDLTAKAKNDEVQVLGTVAKKTGSEPAFKRPRIETPSPLPTFKVRKEKLGDRITALQQLVSPFGKTDTASVLHEAIEYIKFLHDQVNMLSTPYKKNGSPIHRQQTSSENARDQEGSKEDLKSRGLCLVPISSTFPVAAETTTDFWTPTFGGTFR